MMAASLDRPKLHEMGDRPTDMGSRAASRVQQAAILPVAAVPLFKSPLPTALT
jgi:hypothetical protein